MTTQMRKGLVVLPEGADAYIVYLPEDENSSGKNAFTSSVLTTEEVKWTERGYVIRFDHRGDFGPLWCVYDEESEGIVFFSSVDRDLMTRYRDTWPSPGLPRPVVTFTDYDPNILEHAVLAVEVPA